MSTWPIRLQSLEPKFIQYEEVFCGEPEVALEGKDFGTPYQHTIVHQIDWLEYAQGIWFLCPACFIKNGGASGTHYVEVSFHGRGVKDHQGSHNKAGEPSRWNFSGTGYEDLTLSPSIDCECWHGYVQNGQCTTC